jgi:MoaA/NifB/PqqE/SkfB family radical SAM enzyme
MHVPGPAFTMHYHGMVGRLKQYASVAAGSLGLFGGRAPAGPLYAHIGICDPCNHRCVMCWDHPPDDHQSTATAERFGFAPQELMSLATFRSIVDDLHRLGTRRIDLVGRGEPLLNRAIGDMVVYAKSRDMSLKLCTNASRLSPVLAEKFVTSGLDEVNVSLNAGTPETYPLIHVSETPKDYCQVKDNLRQLTRLRKAAGKAMPYVRLSFVIGSRNYRELDAMVRVTDDVGANEAMFVHTVVHDGTRDLALNQDQYRELMASVAGAKATAASLGVITNLTTFATIAPTYLQELLDAPAVVPCYVGWYFANVLANGSVMPCCQCAKPIDRVSTDRSFASIWRSENYQQFRTAAKGLPTANPRLESCECDNCMLRTRNISVHNLLHPLQPIASEGDELYTVKDLVRMKKVDRR